MTTFTEIVHRQNKQVTEQIGPYVSKIVNEEVVGEEALKFMKAIEFNTLKMLDFLKEIKAKVNVDNMCYEVWVNRFKDLYTDNPLYTLNMFDDVEKSLGNLDVFPEQELRDYYVNEVETTFNNLDEAIEMMEGFLAVYNRMIDDLKLN